VPLPPSEEVGRPGARWQRQQGQAARSDRRVVLVAVKRGAQWMRVGAERAQQCWRWRPHPQLASQWWLPR